MRIYYAFIVDSTAEGYKKDCVVSSEGRQFPSKGWMSRSKIKNIKTGKEFGYVDFLGLGHYDFKDEADYEKRSNEIFNVKINEYNKKYLPKMDEIRAKCGYKSKED